MLPQATKRTHSPWATFAQAKASYDAIIPGYSSRQQLHQLGFDPQRTANIQHVTYLQVIQHFMPHFSIKLHHLDPRLQACIQAREHCTGYQVEPKLTTKARYGNAFLDIFNFRRRTRTTGWSFQALIVMHNERVVYKIWQGEPNILIHEDKRSPLGPFQSIGNIFNIKI